MDDVPLLEIRDLEKTYEDGYRAVAFGLLVNTYLKYLSKEYVYMPPTCSCAATSAPASAAGVAFLHGLSPKQINDMLCTCMIHMAGVVCDGAKPSCAFRMFTSLFGCLEAMNRDGMSGSWGYDEVLGKSARDDGSIIMEDNNWFCGDHIAGFSVKTMIEY